jgi:galactonate dehydratase
MKITSYTTWIVPPRWCFLKIETDAGIDGWGEPVVEGRAHTVQTAVDEMMDCLVGRDPARIEDIWQELYRGSFYRGGPILMSAMAGIDQALWDIKGKKFNAPIHELMGGACRDRIRVYQWIGGDRPVSVGEAARQAKNGGATAVKMNGTEEMQFIDTSRKIDELVARVAAIRESCRPLFRYRGGFSRPHSQAHGENRRQRTRTLQPDVHRGAGIK